MLIIKCQKIFNAVFGRSNYWSRINPDFSPQLHC